MKKEKTTMLLKRIIPESSPKFVKVAKVALATTLAAGMMAGCSAEASDEYSNLPPKPDNVECDNWLWDDDLRVWVCENYTGDTSQIVYDDDDDDHHHSSFIYFHNGVAYGSKNSLTKSSSYSTYKSSSSFKSTGTTKSSVSTGSKSGVGSKSSGFGG